MKVLFILPEFEPHPGGGIGTYYRELLSKNKEWESIVIQGSAFDIKDHISSWKEIPIHYLKKSLFQKYKILFNHLSIFPELQTHLASAWAMYDQAKDLNFDIVVCTDWGLGFVPWIINKKKPVIVHLHGSCGQIDYYDPRCGLEFWSKLYLQIETGLLEEADALVTHSKQNIKFWKKRFTNQKNINLIHPAFHFIEKLRITSNQRNNKTGLVIGRIQLWKGPILLCKAIRLLSSADKEGLTIFWVGKDTFYDQQSMNMAEYLKKEFPEIWGKIVIPLGTKNHDEINELITEVSWGLVPSEWDMFNLSAVEHLKNGNPIICSSSAGVSDFISKNLSTIIFNGTPSDLAYSIKEICNKTGEEIKSMGIAGQQLVATVFKSKDVQKTHQALFLSLKDNHPSNIKKSAEIEWLIPLDTYSAGKFDPSDRLLSFWSLKKIALIFLGKLYQKLR